jgi:hypothetical protein
MGRPSERKRRKQLARRTAKAAKRLKAEARRRYRDDFPEFDFPDNGAPPQFVKLVRDTIRSIDFRDRNIFEAWETKFFKRLKRTGAQRLYELCEADSAELRAVGQHFVTKLQHLVLGRIDREELVRWYPRHSFTIYPCGRKIVVLFQSLRTQVSPNGTIYFSRFEPKLEIEGEQKIVGFFGHAIERILDRIVPVPDRVHALDCAFEIVDQCVHFERADLSDGQLAFTFFSPCIRDSFNETIAKEVLRESTKSNRYYFHRVGYCPAVILGDFVVAKTLLQPGYRPTPESKLVWASDVSFAEKKRVSQLVQDWDPASDWSEDDLDHIRFFHDHGIPQVIETEETFYRWQL